MNNLLMMKLFRDMLFYSDQIVCFFNLKVFFFQDFNYWIDFEPQKLVATITN